MCIRDRRMWYDALRETLRITDLGGQARGLCDAQAVDLEQLLSVSWGNGVLYDADKDLSLIHISEDAGTAHILVSFMAEMETAISARPKESSCMRACPVGSVRYTR